jgi:hypothetical protein
MSRFEEGDGESPITYGMWRRTVINAAKGKLGRAALLELEESLLALPEKRLIADEIMNEQGEVCAIGAMAKRRFDAAGDGPITMRRWYNKKRKVNVFPTVEDAKRHFDNGECGLTEELAEGMGMPHCLGWQIGILNDEGSARSPEQRYIQVLAFVQKLLNEPEKAMA